ncbi:hypothetical protein JAAARDRAFT_58423 [Jaapia argillacea MUCL 33604]|uniref:Uncharacterized protein n=1 Tax=Jaapia argillacea MUCL 33604 TaxID=933084 RepID=A0A067PVG3_9AGAM|nr:hypothetical protein JAAARDRAFT_58423 [Jaapia argillacea MUCL 33604]
MILLDEEDQEQRKLRPPSLAAPTSRHPEEGAPGLPDYETSQAQLEQEIAKPKKKGRRRCICGPPCDGRFWRATFYALLIYLVITLAIAIPLLVLRFRRHSRWYPPVPPSRWTDNDNDATLVEMFPSNGIPTQCNIWKISGGSTVATLQYTIPSDMSIFFRSNVSQDISAHKAVEGSLTADINTDPSATDTVISIKLNISSNALFQRTSVCLLESVEGRGVSISVPGNLSLQDSLWFDIAVLFPQTPVPLHIVEFSTYLPVFSQHLAYLQSHVAFDEVTLEGPMSAITVDSLEASAIVVQSSLAPIMGTFNVSQSLILNTIAGPVLANISLLNDVKTGKPTIMDISTGNGAITADVTLIAISPSSTTPSHPPQFISEVTTFSGPLNIDVKHDPSSPPAHIHLRVQNNLDVANVALDSKFIGSFDVQTKFSPASIQELRGNETDPTGQRRERTLVYDITSDSRMVGWVGWGNRPPTSAKWFGGSRGLRSTDGHVEMVSSLSPVLLQLGDR